MPQHHLSRDLLFQGPPDALARLLSVLDVPGTHRFDGAGPPDYAHFEARINSAECTPLRGDFSQAVTLHLFGTPLAALEAALAKASTEYATAIERPAPDGAPFAMTLFVDGARHAVDVLEDEITGETFVQGHTDLRRRLAALRPDGTA